LTPRGFADKERAIRGLTRKEKPAVTSPSATALPDVQAERPERAIALSAVGVTGMRLPIALREGAVLATLELSVDLPAEQRGAHMSRFGKAARGIAAGLSPLAFAEALALEVRARQPGSSVARVSMRWAQPVGDAVHDLGAQAADGAAAQEQVPAGARLSMTLIGSTACPCSFAMSGDRYAHVQRASLEVELWQPTMGPGALRELLEESFSAPVAMTLDRPGEKALVDRIFAKPRFVEDVAREAAHLLKATRAARHALLRVTAYESIHPFDCFAEWRGTID